MDACSVNRRCRGGFTLVEMLAVIVIMGILMALLAGAAAQAIGAARRAAIRAEIGTLDMTVKAFKEKFGDYPPDGSDAAAVKSFLSRAFPRFTGTAPDTGNPAKALVIWLSISGSNPANPFDTSGAPLFDFDPARIRDGMYYQPNADGMTEPYVYFKAKSGGTYTGQFQVPNNGSLVKACKDSRTGGFANSKSFQIRAPGLDGRHGAGIAFPEGTDYDNYQSDDMSNFANGTFGDLIP